MSQHQLEAASGSTVCADQIPEGVVFRGIMDSGLPAFPVVETWHDNITGSTLVWDPSGSETLIEHVVKSRSKFKENTSV